VTTTLDKATATSGDAVLERLRRLHPKRIDLSLGRMERLLARLGHPEQKLPPVVHIAGTNGKGSTTACMKSVLEAAGYGVHVYTSPHLVHFHERIALASPGGAKAIADQGLMDILIECEIANGDEPITYFEVTTAAAFLAFSRNPADIVLLEVGLGGRLDATNVIDTPLLSVITPVSIDHVQFLGDSLAEIAGEKAGILKAGVPGIVAGQDPVARAAIEARAREIGAPLIARNDAWQLGENRTGGFDISIGDEELHLPLPALPGRHQIDNAGLAVAALKNMTGFDIRNAHLAQGLETASWPGRLERLEGGALAAALPQGAELWLDGGHNSAAGLALAGTVRTWASDDAPIRPLYLVIGMMNVKDVTSFLTPFTGLVKTLIGVEIPGEINGLSSNDVCDHALAAGLDARPADDMISAMALISHDCADGTAPRVLICGSLYLAGSVLAAERGAVKTPGELG
jgi:dihydrofolate synthase/folylpolyglutamate synthase